jgi:hypothetical protein
LASSTMSSGTTLSPDLAARADTMVGEDARPI